MGRRRVIHFHMVRDAAWETEGRKPKGEGGGEWVKGGSPSSGGGSSASGGATHIHIHQSAKSAALEAAERQELEKEAQTYSDDVDWEKPALGAVEADAQKLRGTHIHIHRDDPYQQAYEQEAQTYEDDEAWKSPEERADVAQNRAFQQRQFEQSQPAGMAAHAGLAPQPSAPKPMGGKSPAPKAHWRGETGQPVQGESFKASDVWKRDYKPEMTQAAIYASLPPDEKAEMERIEAKQQGRPQTIEKWRNAKKEYQPLRRALHQDILWKGVVGADESDYTKKKFHPALFTEEEVTKATPLPGEKPLFVMLAGRGGSGKTQLAGRAYDPDHAIVLDSDKIKHMLPEFEGWNAFDVHEESSDILDEALQAARERGLNVVLDATLKSYENGSAKLDAFKAAGYRTEGHMMYLPAHKAAQRSVGRYFSPGKKAGANPAARGRFVAPNIILGNTKNEENFDRLRSRWDGWSFWSNDVPQGHEPQLLARGGHASD